MVRNFLLWSGGSLLLLVFSGCSENKELTQLKAALVSDHWSKELGSGMTRERYVYTFFTNGTYKACVFSDFGTRPMQGTWRATRDSKGQCHLLLENQEAYYYWLWRDSVIRYDEEKDVMLISGPRYSGQQELRRTRNPRCQVPRPHHLRPKGQVS